MAVHHGGKGPGHIARSIGGFNPRSLFAGGTQGLVYDFTGATSVWQDTAGTVAAVNNSVVARIDDKSGNGNNATQATGANQPLYKTAPFPRVMFDGIDDILATAAINMSARDEISVIMGVQKLSDAATQVVAENTTGAGSFRVYIPAAGTSWVHGMTGTASSDSPAAGFAAVNTAVVTGLGKIATDTNIIRVNGVQQASVATDQGTGNMGNFAVGLGARIGGTVPFSGSIFALIIINRLLVASEIAQAEAWVNARTGAF